MRHLMFAATLACHAGRLAAQAPALTVERIFGSRDWANDLASLQWDRATPSYTTIDDGTGDLYRVDAASGRREVLVRAADLVPPGANAPVAIEEYAFSPDGSQLLIYANSVRVWRLNTKGTYYVWDFTARRLRPM
ncbi:MAG: S9 family peptidase, partial [Gemmatimonadetes bacterium]|nr:S9 family peptidase [Gemmatimonadota bacterium]